MFKLRFVFRNEYVFRFTTNSEIRMALILDIASLEALFEVYYKRLCETAYRMVLDRDIAEDIVQDLFCKLYERKDELKLSVSVKDYLSKCTISKSLLYIRKVKNVQSKEHFVETGSGGESSFCGSSLSDEQDVLNYTLRNLPDGVRTVFILSRYEKLSFKEISAELKISTRMVESQMLKALEHLREYLI